MGTLLRRATLTSLVALAAFAAIHGTTHTAFSTESLGTISLGTDSVAATASDAGAPARGQLVVVDTRTIDDRHGWLIFTDGLDRDSTVLELGLLRQLKPGDLLSDGGGTIDR